MNLLAEAMARYEADDWIRELCLVVKEALTPFNTGDIVLSFDDIAILHYGKRVLWIESKALRGHQFRFEIDEREMYKADDPQWYVFNTVRTPLFKHFRYRPSLPVDDHIVLGEE